MLPSAEEDLRLAPDEARDAWTGWQDDVDAEFASPRRGAADIVRAAEIARLP